MSLPFTAPTSTMRLYGSNQPLPQRQALRAGPLEAWFEEGDLRSVRLGGVEVVGRIYMALRDRDWLTIPRRLSAVEVHAAADSFAISFQADHRQGEIDFGWQARIEGHADGTIVFRMDGSARSAFLRDRIGLCVLLPAGLAGTACSIQRQDGEMATGMLPTEIDGRQPLLPFENLGSLAFSLPGGRRVAVEFSGEWFEMEDQRNWTDASYKIYGTRLSLPFPVEIAQGTRVEQTIRISVQPAALPVEARSDEESIQVKVDWGGEGQPLPGLGFGLYSDGIDLTENEVERLRALHPHHLRADLWLGRPGWEDALRRGWREAQSLGTSLVLGLITPPDALPALERAARLREELGARVLAWLCFPEREDYQGGQRCSQVVEMARKALPGEILGAGTDHDLIYLNRNRLPLDQIGLVNFAINPQVHAFDHLSLVETLEAQVMAVSSARRLAGGLPVAVSAVTFKPRHNPYASAVPTVLKPGELPPQVDPRQLSLFGAGWTLGSIAALAQGGAAWATYYETVGWRGLMEREGGTPLPAAFPSLPGELFPLYGVFAALAPFSGGRTLPLEYSAPLRVAGLAVRKGEERVLLLANLSGEETLVRVAGLTDIPRLAPFELRRVL